MLTFKALLIVAVSGWAGSAQALDPDLSPSEAFRSGYEAYKAGDAQTAVEALNFAGAKGHPGALWKLGRMYQTGDLVTEDDIKALELFAQVANEHADGNPRGPNAPFVANAFVTLGTYYRKGIAGAVEANPARARRYFNYAASYFGDPEAQYWLATMMLAGDGGDQQERQAAKWFKLAARKGHVASQAEFGRMLYEGIGIERRVVEGLMWLSIARLSSSADPGIQDRHERAFSTAEPAQRRQAIALAEDWLARHGPASETQAQAQSESASQ
jgi:TPR repeat protein